MERTMSRIKIFAIVWLLIISVLFFLPGSALPDEGMFGIPQFDKLVHAGFFAVLVFCWRFYFKAAPKYTWLLLLLAAAYGLGVEFIQRDFIPHRDFDLYDAIADSIGAAIGLWLWTKWYKKNRPL
jgi:VanZ family protein